MLFEFSVIEIDFTRISRPKLLRFFSIRPCAFFSMFLVTRPRSFSLKSKKKKRKTDVKIKLKVVDLASRSATGRKICMFHLQLTGRLHGYCEEEGEKLSPFA